MKQTIYIVRVPGDREYYTHTYPSRESNCLDISSPLKRTNDGNYRRIANVEEVRIVNPANIVIVTVSVDNVDTQQASLPTGQPPMVTDPSSHFRQQAASGAGHIPTAAES